jgi:TonB-dependent receptor
MHATGQVGDFRTVTRGGVAKRHPGEERPDRSTSTQGDESMDTRSKVAIAVAAILGSAMGQANAQRADAEPTKAQPTTTQQSPGNTRQTPPGQTNPADGASAADDLQIVTVTGLRASLKQAMDIKREAVGVVDAISAEDIGKFPDANLSESLQRITGISISRRNGEGALVTARGFGPEYNMVTLNGRMMPAADAFGGGGNGFDGGVNGQNRSFNFANLASESISGVEVYKTSKASVATGGIGATMNILTNRPLDNDSFVANFGVKGVKDTINREGSDINPELSGIFSFTNDDRTFGVGLSGSYQKRNSGASMSTVNDWNIRRWSNTLANSGTQFATGAEVRNAPAEGALYAIPNDIRYHFADRERTRKNGQLTFQFQPAETLTLTADYTYAETEIIEDRGDQTLWMNANRFRRIEFDTGQSVATPLLLEEDEGTTKDFGFEQQHREQTGELKSPGLNVRWQATDRFGLSFDIHDSKATSLPSDPVTGGGETLSSIAVRLPSVCDAGNPDNCTNRVVQTFRFNNKGLPLGMRTVFPQATTVAPASGGIDNFDFTTANLGSQYLRVNYQAQETDITQARLDGDLEFDERGRFQFGVETRAMKSHQQASQGTMKGGDWSVNDVGQVPTSLIEAFSLVNQFEDFSTDGTPTAGFKGDADGLARWWVDTYRVWQDATNQTGVLGFNPGFNQDHIIEEDTDAAYIQYGFSRDFGSMPANLLVGVRYERTDVQSTSALILPTGLLWTDNNDFFRQQGTEAVPFQRDSKYNNWLPAFDFDIELRPGLKGRFSYSTTLARAQYNQLRSAISIQDQGATTGSTFNGNTPLANASNPELRPIESDNFDLSLEYYFGGSSYVSGGLFQKNVKNFIGNEVLPQSLFDIRDQTNGPRAQAAVAALRAGNALNGFQPYGTDDTNLFVMIAMMENAAATGGAAAFNGSPAQATAIATAYDIVARADDPLYTFNVVTPVNNRDAKIKGAEIAAQHFFGDTGFGVYANYTIVDGDVAFDDAGDPNINQFALLGLSDSANAVLMYEKFGFSVRLAFNWRDEYLSNVNVGNFRNPVYVEPYQQFDLNIGYQVNEHLSVAFEGLNLTEEDVRWHGRTKAQVWFVEDQGARYSLGARYKF